MKWNKSNRHTLISFPSFFLLLFSPIFLHLNERHSFLSRDGGGGSSSDVITSQAGTIQGERGQDGGRVTGMQAERLGADMLIQRVVSKKIAPSRCGGNGRKHPSSLRDENVWWIF